MDAEIKRHIFCMEMCAEANKAPSCIMEAGVRRRFICICYNFPTNKHKKAFFEYFVEHTARSSTLSTIVHTVCLLIGTLSRRVLYART